MENQETFDYDLIFMKGEILEVEDGKSAGLLSFHFGSEDFSIAFYRHRVEICTSTFRCVVLESRAELIFGKVIVQHGRDLLTLIDEDYHLQIFETQNIRANPGATLEAPIININLWEHSKYFRPTTLSDYEQSQKKKEDFVDTSNLSKDQLSLHSLLQ